MAIYSDKFNSAYNGSWATLYLEVTEESQSVVNNTTTLKCVMKVKKTTTCTSNKGSGANIYMTINGTKLYSADSFTIKTLAVGSTKTFATKYITVPHNADGTKSISCVAYFYSAVDLGTASINTTFTCTPIPRVSNLALDVSTVPADGTTQVIATATKENASFTDILAVSLGNYSQEIESGVAFTIPEEWCNAIPSATSLNGKVTVTTKNGDTTIGSKSVDLTVTVPDSVAPTIDNVAITEAISAVTSAFGNKFAQNLSQLNVAINASGAYGSTIRSYSAVVDGVTYIQQAFTSNVLNTAGTLNVAVEVVDSRGRTASDVIPINVAEYTSPTITAMTYVHWDSETGKQNSNGDSTRVTISGKVSSVEEQNTKTLKLKYKSLADEIYTERLVPLSDWTFSVDVIINDTDPSMTYEYIAELTDKINANAPATFRVTTGIVTLSRLAGGKGVTLFEEAAEEGFVVGGGKPAKFTGDVFVSTGGEEMVRLLDLFFHVGYVIPTTNPDFDPNLAYPWQTWERYAKGQTLVGVNEDDATFASAGLTGGEKTHTLTIAEMPSHNHTVNYNSTGTRSGGYWQPITTSISGTSNAYVNNTGGGQAHNNLQPYTTVYYWRRTA